MPRRHGPVHVATTQRTYKGKVYNTHLLRRTYRQDGKVKHETLGNLSHLPPDLIDTIRRRLRDDEPPAGGDWDIVRTLPHGHVAAVLATIRDLGLEQLLFSRPSRERTAAIAMIAARIVEPRSKLATIRGLKEETATTSLSLELDIEDITQKELYRALDWLLSRQKPVEKKLAKRHLKNGTLLLYDVSSSYYTGEKTKLAQFGYSRDRKRGFPQIVYGLLCEPEGRPIAVEVFEGNTSDPKTLCRQIEKIRKRFSIDRVALVGDRGMITTARINEELRDVEGLEWITALRSESIKKLAQEEVVQLSLFDETDLAEVTSDDFPGERLIVCRNPLLADRRAHKREELLQATEKKLDEIVAATAREQRPLLGKGKIGVRVGKVLNRYKVGKHFTLEIGEKSFSYRRNEAKIAEEAVLDGIYVIRTSVEAETLSSEETVRAYKSLAKVERAFRSLKTVDLKVRPIFHRLDDRIRAHVFLCMLAYYVEWHMRRRLAPLLFDDDEREAAERTRRSIVAPAPRSAKARRKDGKKQTDDGYAVESFQTLLANLATLAKNRVRVRGSSPDSAHEFYLLTRATEQQQRALDLLGAKP